MTEVRDTDIAIVGMACRFPGASTPEAFWQNIRDGVVSIRRLSREELLAAGADESELDDPAYVPVSAVLDDVPGFDAAFFGYGPRDAAIMDPQHRHFLEVSWQALEHAGHAPGTSEARVGVFAGSGLDTYLIRNLVTNPELIESTGLFLVRHTGNDKDFLATEVSYKLDLTGPSVNVQTACSTSLVAMHLAGQSLLSGECDVALAGGSTIEVPAGRGYRYHEGEVLSPDGVCRPFDAASRGTVLGSGTGAVVLRRLQDAIDDGDTIYAVIRASAINNDGSAKVSYLAPSVGGHAAAISEALGVAGVGADTISYFESHGTGTAIGDPIEIAAATQAFRENGATTTAYCRVGSTKANIGHLDTAAGVASVIKTAMALHHRELPPLPTLGTPSPEIDFPSTPFYLSATAAPWEPVGGVRRAGVSSLGVGGTNAHIILEGWEGPPPEVTAEAETATTWHALPLAARSETALDSQAIALAAFLRANPDARLVDIAHTLQVGRATLPHRRVVVARTVSEAIAALEEPDVRRQVRGHADGGTPDVVFMFPGGGSQYPQMARDLYEHEPVFRQHVDASLSILEGLTDLDVRALMFPPGEDHAQAAAALAQTAAALPAIFTIEYAVAHLWMSRGVEPSAMTGHSLGEYTAACLAGVMSLEDALRLVVLRARLVDRVSVGGGMLSVGLTEADLGELPEGLSVASINAPTQCVVSGEERLIEALEAQLAARDVSFQRLQLTAAGHSAMLDPILDEFLEGVRAITLRPPTRPYVSNVTGTWVRAEDATDPAYWSRHLRHTVRFAAGLDTIVSAGSRVLLEVGPGQTLRSLAGQQPVRPRAAVSSMRHRDETTSDVAYWLRAFGQLWATGVAVDWARVRHSGGRRIALPTYPFEHQRHWIEPGVETVSRSRPPLDRWFARPVWEPLPLRVPVPPLGSDERWLVLVDHDGLGRQLATALRGKGQDVVTAEVHDRLAKFSPDEFGLDPGSAADFQGLVGALRQAGRFPTRIVHGWLLDASADAPPLHRAAWAQRRGFDALLLLSQALITEGVATPVDLTVLTRGAHAVLPGERVAAEQALVHGVTRVLPREAPEFTARVIDLAPRAPGGHGSLSARRILDEIASGSAEPVIAYRGEQRWVERMSPFALPAVIPGEAAARPGGTYLVTGGLGGIGLTLARSLASVPGVRLALLGRTALVDADPRAELVRELRAMGAEVITVAADVADGQSMRRALGEVHAAFGPIHGVVHAAGLTDDAPLATKDLPSAHAVLRAKVAGTLVLDATLAGEPLEWFLLCSSTSALVGPPGQVDYVAANAFLDAFAHMRGQRRGRTIAVNWGIWRDVGIAASEVARAAAPGALPTPEGLHPLLGLRATSTGAERTYEQVLSPATHWPLAEHRLADGTPLLPGSSYLELCRAVAQDEGLQSPEIANLALLAPVWGREDVPTRLRVSVRPAADGLRLLVRSRLEGAAPTDWTECAEAELRSVDSPPQVLDLRAIEGRLVDRGAESRADARGAQEHLLQFGPRWRNLRALHLGASEALGWIELEPAYLGDLAEYQLHPAVLDTAIGLGLSLLAPSGLADGVLVPVSYRRIQIHGAVPARVAVYVTAKSDPLAMWDHAAFDVRIADESGSVLVTVEDVTFRRVTQAGLARPATEQNRPVSALLEAGARRGIAPREGAEVFERIIAGPPVPQVLASSLSLEEVERLVVGVGASAVKVTRPGGDAGYVEPRDDIERTIAGYWSELLGIERVSIDDHFFDLGGHSLIAIRLFSRLRQAYGVDLGLATLFDSPTVERLAELVRAHGGAASPSTDVEQAPPGVAAAPAADHQYIVPIQSGGTRIPFFCVHGRGGNVLELRDLSRRVGADIPFYGIQARGIDGRQPPHESIEAMALDYVRAVQEVRPSGPYVLGGYSGGGVVALEMARLLRESGQHVAHVILLDSYHPRLDTASVRSRYGWVVDRTMELGAGRLAHRIRGAIAASVRDLRLAPLRQVLYTGGDDRDADTYVEGGASFKLASAELARLHGFADLSEHFVRLLPAYRTRQYDGAVTLLRASTYAFPRTLGWRPFDLPRLRVIEVQGDHLGIMREPFVSGLAATLRAALLSAEPGDVGAAGLRIVRTG